MTQTPLRNRLNGYLWVEPGFLPELLEIRWVALDEWRARHVEAVKALQSAKSAGAEREALLHLCTVTEHAVRDLRDRSGYSWSTNPATEESEPDLAYREAVAKLDGWREAFGASLIGNHGKSWHEIARLEPTAAERGESEALVEAVKQRMRVSDDSDRLRAFTNGPLRSERLVGGSILPTAVAQAAAVRVEVEQMQFEKSGAAVA